MEMHVFSSVQELSYGLRILQWNKYLHLTSIHYCDVVKLFNFHYFQIINVHQFFLKLYQMTGNKEFNFWMFWIVKENSYHA